jgi:two-component system, LytTR family, sensor kinase
MKRRDHAPGRPLRRMSRHAGGTGPSRGPDARSTLTRQVVDNTHDSMPTDPRPRPPLPLTRRAWAWSFAVWTVMAFFLCQRWYLSWRDRGGGLAWGQSLAYALLDCYVNALFTPPLLALGWRFRLDRRLWPRNLALQLLVSLPVAAVVFVAGYVPMRGLAMLFGHPPSIYALTPFSVLRGFLDSLLVTWQILAVSHGLLYYREARDRALTASRLEAALARARLDALGMQLRPHFLFNTLNGICALIRTDPEAAERMVELLSDLLRESIKPVERGEVSLREEIRFPERYLEIESIRFGSRLEVGIEVDPAAEETQVPHLILHPLVENALRHGVARRSGKGVLRVSTRRRAQNVEIQISDNGPGFALGPQTPGQGLGLANTRSRLDLFYGAAHRLEIREEGGVQVKLTVPFRRGWEASAS